MSRYRDTMRRMAWVLAGALAVYALAAVLLASVTDSARSACNDRNAGRLTALRDASSESTHAKVMRALALADGDEAAAKAWDDKLADQGDRTASLIAAAEATGAPSAEGAVTVQCEALNPDRLPWPGT